MGQGALAPLRYWRFRLLLTGRMVNSFGNAFAPIALAFAVLDLTGSVGDLGLVVAVRSLTNVLFLLAGGVIADRLPRHLVMVSSNVVAAATQAAVAGTVLTHTATLPMLVAFSAINGFASAISQPASSALTPQTVPDTLRKPANALSRLGSTTATIVGAPAGGLLVAYVGPGWGLLADAATFVVSGCCFALLRLTQAAPPRTAHTNILADLREGWSEVTRRSWLWVVVVGFMLFNAAWSGTLQVVGPAMADATFGRRLWGLILAFQTIGMVIGAALALRVHTTRLLLFGVASVATATALPAALALRSPFVLLVVAALAAGIGLQQFNIAWETSLQDDVPADRLARVYSYDMAGSFMAMPVGQVAAGRVTEWVGARTTMLGAAALMALAVLGMVAHRRVRTLEHRPAIDDRSGTTAAI